MQTKVTFKGEKREINMDFSLNEDRTSDHLRPNFHSFLLYFSNLEVSTLQTSSKPFGGTRSYLISSIL